MKEKFYKFFKKITSKLLFILPLFLFLFIPKNSFAATVNLNYGACMNPYCSWVGYFNPTSTPLSVGYLYEFSSAIPITTITVHDTISDNTNTTTTAALGGSNYSFILPENAFGSPITGIGFNSATSSFLNIGDPLTLTIGAFPTTISLAFPALGDVLGSFPNWIINLNMPAPTQVRKIGVEWGTSSSTNLYADERYVQAAFNGSSTEYLAIKDTLSNIAISTTTTIYATPYFYNDTIGAEVFGARESFTVNPSIAPIGSETISTPSGASTTIVGSEIQTLLSPAGTLGGTTGNNLDISSGTSLCVRPSSTNIGDALGFAACSVISWIIVPPQNGLNPLYNSLTALQNVPPFVWLFGVNYSLQGAAATVQAPAAWVYDDAPANINGATTTWTLLPANGASITNPWLLGVINKIRNLWFNFVLDVLVLFIIGMTFKIMLPK